jgi:ABC-type molybdate transport system substrate-binding protein
MAFHKHHRKLYAASFLFALFCSLFIFVLVIQKSYAAEINKDVSVMYAGSLVKIMEKVVSPSFHNQTGYNFIGEGKGSVQL